MSPQDEMKLISKFTRNRVKELLMNCVEKHIVIAAAPATIFKIYEDVGNWKQWDPDTKTSLLTKGLQLGSKGFLTPTKGRTVPLQITAIERNTHFTASSITMLFRMDFEHELSPLGDATKVTHRVVFRGLLRPLLARLLGPRIEHGLPITLQRLKSLAEKSGA